MGRVFSWQEIVHGQVPNLSAFEEMRQMTDQALLACSDIRGAIIYGSVVYGQHTIRSDMDYLLVYRIAKRRHVDLVLTELAERASRLYVPLQFTKQEERLAGTPFAHVGVLFASHLRCAVSAGGVVGENPLNFFSFNVETAEEEFRTYLANKIRSLEEYLSVYPVLGIERRFFFLKLLLEAPVHTARKMVQLLGSYLVEGDSRQHVFRPYAFLVPMQATRLRYLMELDERYSRELEEQLVTPNAEKYLAMIQRIENCAEDVLEFLHANAHFLLERR